MRKIFVSATVMAALCSLAISVAPALGLEFEGEATESVTSSTTSQTIQLGGDGWVECSKMTMKAYPLTVGAFKRLKVQLEKYTTCKYHHNLTSEPVSDTATCAPITLESADLVEIAEEEFSGGVKFGCTLEFASTSGSGCLVEISGSTSVLPEYIWKNLNGTLGHYESLIEFKIENLNYAITKIGSTVCKPAGDIGRDGEYEAPIPIKYVTIFPEF